MAAKEKFRSAVTYKMIAEALFENYESIYDVHVGTHAYKTYYQSAFYQQLELKKEGEDFFRALPVGIERIIAPEDQSHVFQMLQKEALLAGISREKHYSLVYRIQSGGRKIYHQLKATSQKAEDGLHILMGIKNIDDVIRQKIENENKVASLQQKEHNHMEAILAGAAAYLEANLTRNLVLEKEVGHKDDLQKKIKEIPTIEEIPVYDDIQEWIGDHLIVENKERYLTIGSRKYLIDCFRRGEMRASVSFSVYGENGDVQPCKAVFYLYKEKVTGDLHVFCVIYDLTEQQRKEKELEELEQELSMSRIRNSTSQMKPHFLYNALGSIQELILTEPQYASNLLGDFMMHMRSCVRAMANDEPILFSDELKNIKAYVNIEKMRLGDRLDIQYDIKAADFYVLPLSIQPLVENAIRHGVHKRGRKGGKVIVHTRSERREWVVQVEDTGVGFNTEKVLVEIKRGVGDSTGLSNIKFRLEKIMRGHMYIQSTEGEGTTVTVRIPKEVYEDESNHSRR